MQTALLTLAWLWPVLGCLVLATGCGWWMSWRRPQPIEASFAANWNARVRAWWWMLAVGSLALAGGRGGLVLLFAAISLQCYREFLGAATASARTRWRPALRADVSLVYLLVPLQYVLIVLGAGWAILLVTPLLLVVLVGMGVGRRVGGACGPAWDGAVAGAVVCVYGMSFVLSPLWLWNSDDAVSALLAICFLALMAQASDVLQYLWGNAIGRRRLAPSLSPGKTVEGLVGGVISCGLLAVVMAPLFGFGRVQAGLLATWIALWGVLGGLLLSALKRRRGIKDWGTLLPGHGGMLDRVDSLWLSAPGYTAVLALFPGAPQ